MQNRRQRRAAEKAMGFHKIEKSLSPQAREVIKARKREYVKQMLLMKAQEEENARVNEKAEMFSKTVETWMNAGKTREEAEALAQESLDLENSRNEKLAARRERQKNG